MPERQQPPQITIIPGTVVAATGHRLGGWVPSGGRGWPACWSVLVLVAGLTPGQVNATPPGVGQGGGQPSLREWLDLLDQGHPADQRAAAHALVRQADLAMPAILDRIAAITAKAHGQPAPPDVVDDDVPPGDEVRQRLVDLRSRLDAQRLSQALDQPTRATAVFTNRPAGEILSDLAGRFGWRVRDRRQLPATGDMALTVSCDNEPVLTALSRVAALAGAVWRARASDEIVVESLPGDGTAPTGPEVLVGAVLARLGSVTLERDWTTGQAIALWSIDLVWEPRINALAIEPQAFVLKAWDAAGRDRRHPRPGSSPRGLPGRSCSTTVSAVTLAPTVGTSHVECLEVVVVMAVVARSETLTFDLQALANAPPTQAPQAQPLTHRQVGLQSGLPVVVRSPQNVGARWQTQVIASARSAPQWRDTLARGVPLTLGFQLSDAAGNLTTASHYWQGSLGGEPTFQVYEYRSGQPPPTALLVEVPVTVVRHAVSFRFELVPLGTTP